MTTSHRREGREQVDVEGRVISMMGQRSMEAQDVEDDELPNGEDEALALDPCLGGPSDLLVLD